MPCARESGLLAQFSTFHSNETMYNLMYGINLTHIQKIAYLRFYTPIRLLRFIIRVKRKAYVLIKMFEHAISILKI